MQTISTIYRCLYTIVRTFSKGYIFQIRYTTSFSFFKGFIYFVFTATDCHIGYAEKDPVRQNDSFNSFEEILQLAHQNAVYNKIFKKVVLLKFSYSQMNFYHRIFMESFSGGYDFTWRRSLSRKQAFKKYNSSHTFSVEEILYG